MFAHTQHKDFPKDLRSCKAEYKIADSVLM